MSPLRRTGRPPGGLQPALTRAVASVLVLVTALLLVRASAVATTARGSGSDVCVPPVQGVGSCTSTSSSTTSTRSSTPSTTTTSTATTGTRTETTSTSTESASTDTTGGTTTSTGGSGTASSPATRGTPSPSASRLAPPPPPLPPPSPGSAAVPPEQAVQRIVMVPAVSGPIAPGDTVEVQAILEAQRGTDIFAVPHVPVAFAIVSSSGGGAAVTPAKAGSGDTGVAIARVRTGDRPGDTVVSATSGTASAQLTLHTDIPATGASARVTGPATSGGDTGSGGGHRVALIGLLVALGVLGAISLGLVRRRQPG